MDDLVQRIRNHSQPMVPIPTGETPRLQPLDGIRAVAFDVYGTLVISGSGDVGTHQNGLHAAAFQEALAAAGLAFDGDGVAGEMCWRETIERHHQRSREAGIVYPEVDIVDVWRETLEAMDVPLPVDEVARQITLQRVAVEFECRTNPVWPMPHAKDVLRQLLDAGMTLAIISNAQFYTPLMLEALFGETPERMGFAADLQIYSYRHQQAKPGVFLYEQCVAALSERRIAANEAQYVGNDMLKDVMPAIRVGFRTALFAGDRRSLRKRDGDDHVRIVTPDLVVTELRQIVQAVE